MGTAKERERIREVIILMIDGVGFHAWCLNVMLCFDFTFFHFYALLFSTCLHFHACVFSFFSYLTAFFLSLLSSLSFFFQNCICFAQRTYYRYRSVRLRSPICVYFYHAILRPPPSSSLLLVPSYHAYLSATPTLPPYATTWRHTTPRTLNPY